MSILKAKKGTQNITSVIPDRYEEKEVAELHARGYTNIHNPETGKKYHENCKSR